jgi:hypothetical protein
MPDFSREELKAIVIEALKSEESREVLIDLMATKIELMTGWSCKDAQQRVEIRKDMEFARELRLTARRGGEKLLMWLIAAMGVAGVTVMFGPGWLDRIKH